MNRLITRTFRSWVQKRQTTFGRYFRLSINAAKGSPFRLAVSYSTSLNLVTRSYSSQCTFRCQDSSQACTKSKVSAASLPVLAKQITTSPFQPSLSKRSVIYAELRPPLKLIISTSFLSIPRICLLTHHTKSPISPSHNPHNAPANTSRTHRERSPTRQTNTARLPRKLT